MRYRVEYSVVRHRLRYIDAASEGEAESQVLRDPASVGEDFARDDNVFVEINYVEQAQA